MASAVKKWFNGVSLFLPTDRPTMPCAGAGDDETPALAGTLSFSTHYSPATR